MGERPQRIVVAMSGGVDSSVAAARLVDAGHDVVGVTLHLWDYEQADRCHGRCCAPEDQYDARRVADKLGFPHFTFDRRAEFARAVVEPFVDAYLEGTTPSPCVSCNRHVKLRELIAIADRLGARKIATGHYARLVARDGAPPRLASGADRAKDQSYFLYATPAEWLKRLLFPLGDSTKADVRAEAIRRRLPGADKGESQELCFVPPRARAYAEFVEERAAARVRPGPIVDSAGRVVGEHGGVHRFTVGQRRGVGVAAGKPVFVTRIDPRDATVQLGHESALLASVARVGDVTLAAGASLPMRARVRVRFRHEGEHATVSADGTGAAVRFDAPVRAITAGQVAVFYDESDRVVLGGGRIVGVDDRTQAGALPSLA